MVQIKGKTIIYTTPDSDQLGQVSPYLFIEKLAEKISEVFPSLRVNKVFASKNQHAHQIYCKLPSSYANDQIRLIKVQIDIIAASLLADLQEKIYSARIAG